MNETIIKAVRPWNSIDAGRPLRRISTRRQQEIDYCLEHCPYADGECVSCCPYISRARNATQIKVIVNSSRSTKEISEALGVGLRTAQRYIQLYRDGYRPRSTR